MPAVLLESINMPDTEGAQKFYDGRNLRNEKFESMEGGYVRGVALYKSTHKADPLKEARKRLQAEYPSSEWTKRAKPYSLL